MIGGEAADIERVRPVLSCMGNQFFICGGQGMGHAMKMTNNLLATTIMCANTEALAIGAKCGLTLETMVEVMKTTMGWNQQLAVALPKKAFLGDDSPGFMVKLAAKDVRLAVAAARQQGFEPMVGAGALATLDRAAQLGRADRDTAALLFLREEQLGIRVRPAASPAAT
jgi:3-hydroxyisobutyrate dehydrogenase-like beta-hydroxyacid dehydrogenase